MGQGGGHGDGGCPPPAAQGHRPVTFLRVPRSSSSQAASAPGSAAQEGPGVPRAARSAAQPRSCPSASTSCHQDEALKAATSRASPQAARGGGSWGPGRCWGPHTGWQRHRFGSKRCPNSWEKYLCGTGDASLRGSPCGKGGEGCQGYSCSWGTKSWHPQPGRAPKLRAGSPRTHLLEWSPLAKADS